MTKDNNQEEGLEKAMRSKIERRTANNILTYLEFYLREELVGMVDERHRILEKSETIA